MKSMTVSNVCAEFRVTGLHPLNRDIFSDVQDPPLVRESGLAFIPLYSPATRRTKPLASEQCLESSSPHTTLVMILRSFLTPLVFGFRLHNPQQ